MVGAPASEIAKLAQVTLTAEDVADEPECVICNDEFAEGETLIELGASVNAEVTGYLTPLHFACEGHHTVLADLLLSRGARKFLSRNRFLQQIRS